MSGSSFAPILLNSFKVIASLFLQYAVGALVAWAGVIKEGDMRAFSAVMNAVLIPVLSVVSLGRGLSPAVFASDGWILALLGSMSMVALSALAIALRPLAKPEPQFRRVYVLMMAIGNVVAIPLSVTQALCELGTFEAELPEAECLIRSRALVFTYVSFNSFFIWIVAYGYVVDEGEATSVAESTPESAATSESAATAAKESLEELQAAKASREESQGAEPTAASVNQRTDACGVMLEAAAGVAQEAASAPEPSRVAETAGRERGPAAREEQQEAARERSEASDSFSDNRRPEASDSFSTRRRTSKEYVEMVEAGEAAVAEGRGATVGVPPEPSREPGTEPAVRALPLRLVVRRQLLSLLRRPPVVGLLVGLLVGLITPLQRLLFERGAPLAPIGQALSALSEGTVPVMNLMLGFSMGHKLAGLTSWRQVLGSAQAGISVRTMSVLTLGKMLALPCIQCATLYGLLRGGALPPSRLARVIAFVEAAPPTATIVVVLAHMARKPRAAQLVAWAIVPQYALAVLSLTLVIAFALAITEP